MADTEEAAIQHDQLIGKLDQWKEKAHAVAQDAGEIAQDVGDFVEKTGVNKKALAFVRGLHKMKPEKRDDVLRSLDEILPMARDHWTGQSIPDMLEEADISSDPVDIVPDDERDDYLGSAA